MSLLDEWGQIHAELVEDARASAARAERFGRLLEQARAKKADAPAPTRIEYDRERLDEPPRAVEPREDEPPRCNCGLPAEFKKSAPQNPKQWAAYFCARPKSDPKNCGYRKWLDL